MSDDEGRRILAEARAGGGAAVAELVEGLRPRIVRLAGYYAARCPEELGDLEQEAWVAILEALPEVRPGVGDPRQHLLQVGRWAMLHYINRQSLRSHEELSEEWDDPVAATATGRTASQMLLELLFAHLTDRQAVILRALLAGYTSAEAARLLECSTANIAWHMGRIRDAYRRLTTE